MKIVIDMNLSPLWVATLQTAGIEAMHWSNIGDAHASDLTILAWALAHDHIVFTDMGALATINLKRAKVRLLPIRKTEP